MTADQVTMPPFSESPDDVAFWTDFARHRLTFQRCTDCGRVRHPPMPSCPWCGATGTEEIASSGRGRVYSWVRVHVPFREEFRADVPYTVVTVTMDEGCRMFGRLDGEVASAELIGSNVEARFVDHNSWTECRFAPAREAA